MSRINVEYQGQRVGELAEARGGIFFEYDPTFIAGGHELSPLHLPIGPGIRGRETTPTMRLPGLFEDSLPDRWGRRLMFEWFRAQGAPEHSVTALMMLAYVGNRAMGALSYSPTLEIKAGPADLVLGELHDAAATAEHGGPIDLAILGEVGSLAGGARPKALIGIHRENPAHIVAGAADLPAEFDAWIVKFDTSENSALGPIEEAYARMARAAGIEMPETRLLETQYAGRLRQHFAVRRFDREACKRIHHHTLAGMCHVAGGDLDYSALLRVARRITQDEREVWHAYRRAVFNVLASNRDDHGKNHGFLYDGRQWKVGPAYDLTFAGPRQLPERGLAVAGERRNAGVSHLLKLATVEGLDKKRALAEIDRVRAAVSRWDEFSNAADVPSRTAQDVGAALNECNARE